MEQKLSDRSNVFQDFANSMLNRRLTLERVPFLVVKLIQLNRLINLFCCYFRKCFLVKFCSLQAIVSMHIIMCGVQVERRDGSWIDAIPIPNTVLVNIADLMQRWTSDRLISAVCCSHSNC